MSTAIHVALAQTGKGFELESMTPLVQALFQRLQDGQDLPDATTALMADAGLLGEVAKSALAGNPKIRAGLERMRSAGLILMEPGGQRVRLTSLGEQSEPMKLPLEVSAATDLTRGSAALVVGVDLELALQLAVINAQAAATMGLSLAATDVLHCFSFAGNLGVSGAVEAPRLAVSAELRAAAGITWYFERHREDTALGSTVDAAVEISQGAFPWSLAQVRRVLEQPTTVGRHMDGLRAIDVIAERNLKASAAVSVARGFVAEAEVSGAEGPGKVQLLAAAVADFRFSVGRAGLIKIRLTREGEDVVLDLDHHRSRSRELGFEAGIKIGIEGLDRLANGWLDKLLPPLDPELRNKLDAWSQPGARFVEKLQKRLGEKWGEQLRPLAELVLGGISADHAAQALSTQLVQRWSDELNGQVGLVGERAELVLAHLLAVVNESVSIPEQILAPVRDRITAAVQALQDDLKAEFGSYVESVQGRTKAQLETLFAPLQALGEQVNTLVAAGDGQAERLVGAIEKLVQRYQSLRGTFTQAAQKSAKLKLAAAISAASSSESGETRQLRLRFAPSANDAAAGLFQRLVLGQGEIALDEIAALATAGAGVRIESGSLSSFAKRVRSLSFSLDLFGLQFSDSRILSADVRVEIDASGRVLAFDGVATQTRISSNPRSTQAARFTTDFDLIDIDPEGLPGTLGLSFELIAEKPLRQKSLAQFLGSFVDAKLVSPEQANRAALHLNEDSDRKLAVSVVLSGLATVMERASTVSADTIGREVLRDCVGYARRRGGIVGRALPKLPTSAVYAWVLASGTHGGASDAARETVRTELPTLSLDLRPGGDLSKLAREYRALHLAVVSIPATVKVLAEIGALAKSLQGRQLLEAEVVTARQRLDALLRDLHRAASPVVGVSDAISRLFNERLPDRAVALLAAFARLGADGNFRAHVVLSPYTVDGNGVRQLGAAVEL